MKKSKKIGMIFAMALLLGGGIGTAFAIGRQAANSSGTGAFDNVINLYWGSKSTTASLSDIPTVAEGVPQYRYLAVTPESSAGLEGTVSVKFTLAVATPKSEKTGVLTGLTVDVYKTSALATDDTVAELIAAGTHEFTLKADNLEGTATFDVEKNTTAAGHETNAYYAIKVLYDGTPVGEGNELAGQVTIAQSFAVKAVA